MATSKHKSNYQKILKELRQLYINLHERTTLLKVNNDQVLSFELKVLNGTISMIDKIINPILSDEEKKYLDSILSIICKHFKEKKILVKSPLRKQSVVKSRHFFAYIVYTDMNKKMSMPKLAAYFKHKDHTSVLHSINKIKKGISKDDSTKEIHRILLNKINNSGII